MPSIEIREELGVRYLHFGSDMVQGAMRIARPWALELEYTREMMMPLLLRAERGWPSSVLQIGLGSASLTRFLHRHRPRARVTVVEIEPQVVAAARQFFKLPEESARLALVIADGYEYLAASRREFDLVLVDGYDENGRSGMLDTVPFYLNCRYRLTPSGMVAINLLDRRGGVKASIARVREAFGERVLVLPPTPAGNVVVLAAAGDDLRVSFDDVHAAALELHAATGLDLRPTLARLVVAHR